MHSILFQIGSFPIYTYGLILAIAISSGLIFAGYLARKRGIDPFDMIDIGLLSVIVGLLGARLGYVIQHPETFAHNLFSVLNFRLGGITIIGGIIFGYLALAFFCRRYKLSPWLCIDLYTAPLLWGMAVGRLGCIAQGCCPGKVCDPTVLGAMYYPLGSPLGTAPRYPSQVYELLLDLILMAFCLWFFCRKNKFQGQTFWLGVSGYSLIRFFVEFFRDSKMCGYFSLAQWVCLAMFVIAALGAFGVFGKEELVSYKLSENESDERQKKQNSVQPLSVSEEK